MAKSKGPSIILTRTPDVTPLHLKDLILNALRKHSAQLEEGAILVVDEVKMRLRLLPIP